MWGVGEMKIKFFASESLKDLEMQVNNYLEMKLSINDLKVVFDGEYYIVCVVL